MYPELRNTIVNSQIEAHITYLVTWLTNYYIPQTQPLNNIRQLRNYGKDKYFTSLADRYVSFEISMSPGDCTFGEALGQNIKNFAHRDGTARYHTSHNYYAPESKEYIQRAKEYIQHVDIKDFPCNNCMYNLKCDTQTNIMLFLQGSFTPMEEAYIAMFLEIHESGSHSHAITFIEELVWDSFRRNIDEEYDHLVLGVPTQDLSEHVDDAIENEDLSDELDPGVLEELERAVLTPEELTLRWASRQGGANNL